MELASLMKYVFLFLMAITGLFTILCLPQAYSDFSTNDKYIVQASGYLSGNQTIFDSSIALQLTMGTKTGSTIQSSLDNGLVTIADAHYLNTGIWQTSILRDGKYFVIQGDAQDQNGNMIHLNLFGRIINSNQDGSVYTVTGKIIGSETMKVSYGAKIISTNPVTAKPTTLPTSQTIPGQQSSPNKVSISIVYGASDQSNQVHYTPSNVQIAPGTTIVWTNNDSVPHRIMSGIAKPITTDQSTPVFTSDGKIDSRNLAPGQSFQYTVTNFDTTQILDSKIAQIYGIPQDQTVGDISFFDPNYPFMVGIISPLIPPSSAQGNIVQMSIVSGASNPNNVQFLSPSSILMTSGSTLELINNDSVPHQIQSGKSITTTLGGAKGPAPAKQPQFASDNILNTGIIAPGQHYRVTIAKTGTIQIFDPSFTWINGIVVSSSTTSTTPIAPVQISIAPGSSLAQGTATQQQFNQYNTYYEPETIQIVPGTPIIWVNNDSIEHTILSGVSTQTIGNPFTPDGKIASGKIAPGQTFTVIINDTGIIRFYDPQYTWMNGVIISMSPTSGNQIIGTKSLHTN
jgi:plastocyanin